nr:MAG TPA: hypothetical protein [Caudoviricetes sp.]
MKGYKGFEPGLVCKGKQYAENTVFKEDKAEPCARGMHFCEDPFEVLNYYPIIDNNGNFNEFAEVEALDEPITDDDKKFASTELKIGAKLSFKGFIEICVDFVLSKTKRNNDKISSGNYAQIGSSGYYAKIGSSGDFAQIGSSGNYAKIGSSGYYAQIGSSGNYAQIGSSGNSAKIGSSGNFAQIGSSGNYAQIGSSGYYAQIGSSGDYAQIGSSGDYAQIGSGGRNSVIMCAGNSSKAKAKKGSWITLAEWQYIDNEWTPVCVKTEQVDGERIKEDTYYQLKGGEFVECE